MATKWEGKSKGTVLGYKIFVFFIKNLGLTAAYILLVPVALYYLLFSVKSTKALFYYFNKRLGYSNIKSLWSVYKNYIVFGQTIIDKTAIGSGLKHKFTYEFDGIEKLNALLKQGKGGILISAHIGNFEIGEFFFDDIDLQSQINLVITDAEHLHIKAYLNKVTHKSNLKIIVIQNDFSHIYKISAALNNGELVCITGDRYIDNTKTFTDTFLGAEAEFPSGPFQIASKLKTPVAFVYVMKASKTHYHLYTRTTQTEQKSAQEILKVYIQDLELVLQKYPLQWFNYFKFWN